MLCITVHQCVILIADTNICGLMLFMICVFHRMLTFLGEAQTNEMLLAELAAPESWVREVYCRFYKMTKQKLFSKITPSMCCCLRVSRYQNIIVGSSE